MKVNISVDRADYVADVELCVKSLSPSGHLKEEASVRSDGR